jgi:hypothetical protein
MECAELTFVSCAQHSFAPNPTVHKSSLAAPQFPEFWISSFPAFKSCDMHHGGPPPKWKKQSGAACALRV